MCFQRCFGFNLSNGQFLPSPKRGWQSPLPLLAVISEHGITNAILGSRSGASKRLKKAAFEEGALLPLFLAPKTLEPLITEDLRAGPLKPIEYTDDRAIERGYEATLLPAVCEIWLKAREAGTLQKQQLGKAMQAEILMRSLAKVGITALVDEATGYQEVRNKEALRAILDAFLRQELAMGEAVSR